jgi:hypothetical protein
MSWPALVSLMLGSGLAGALLQRLLDHFLNERTRRRSQRSELGLAAARAVGEVLESIVLLVREHSFRTGSADLDAQTSTTLMGDLGNKLVRHIQLIPDPRVREELQMVDVSMGYVKQIAAGLADDQARDGYLRHDGNVCVVLAVLGLRIVGAFLRGERFRSSEYLRVLWAAMDTPSTPPLSGDGVDRPVEST